MNHLRQRELQNTKRRYSLCPVSPNTKRSRLSTSGELTLAGKCLVETPLLLPDGFIINWSTANGPDTTPETRPSSRSTSGPSHYFGVLKPDLTQHPTYASGSGRTHPIIITNSDDEAPAIKLPTSFIHLGPASSQASSSTVAIPPRYRKIYSKAILVDSSSDEEDFDNVSYRMRNNFPDDLNLDFHDSIVILKNLPSNVNFKDISKLLIRNSFASSLVQEITFFPGRTASVQFTHHHLADAAYTVLDRMSAPFPWKGHHDILHVDRCPRAKTLAAEHSHCLNNTRQPEVAVSGSVPPRPNRDLSLLYGALRKDVYEDEASDGERGSSSQEDQPLPQTFGRDADRTWLSNNTASRPQAKPDTNSDSDSDHDIEKNWQDGVRSDEDMTLRASVLDSEKLPTFPRSWKRKMRAHPITTSSDRDSNSPLQASQRSRTLSGDSQEPSEPSDSGGDLHAFAEPLSKPLSRRSDTIRPIASETIYKSLSRVPKAPHNRARRLLAPASSELPITTVSMRSDTQFFDPHKRHRISSYSLPFRGEYCHVEDACIIGDTIVVGYSDGPCQISLIPIIKVHRHPNNVSKIFQDKPPLFVGLNHRPHIKRVKAGKTIAKGGVHISCLAPVRSDSTHSTVNFISGGYDKSMHLWTVRGESFEVTNERITAHKAVPYALACRGRKVIFSAGKSLLTTEMEHLSAEPESASFSNIIHQIHVHPQAQNVTILELNHLDFQIQLFDDRSKHGFDRRPDSLFGYRHGGRADSRYSRGSAHFSHFVRGYPDGCIQVWDYRNTKHPIVKAQHQRAEPVVHTVFTSTQIIAYGKETVTFLDHNGNAL